MTNQDLPPEFLDLLRGVQARRPKTVIDHILQHGFVTTEELRDLYGYNHPPRGARDVRELGIPLETFRVTGSDGRSIGAYRFGDPAKQRSAVLSGRTAIPSAIKSSLVERYGAKCNIYLEPFPERELQVDHRVPFEISGDEELSTDVDDYMLLCPSANRAKSWSCEHCENWSLKIPDNCQSCYWAFPEEYTHIAMRDLRRLDIIWSGEESAEYDQIRTVAQEAGEELPLFVKSIIRRRLELDGIL